MYSTLQAPLPLYTEPSDQSFSFYEDDSAYWSFCSDYTELATEKVDINAAPVVDELINYPLTPETVSPSTSYDYDYAPMPAMALPAELEVSTVSSVSAPVTPAVDYYNMPMSMPLYSAPASAPAMHAAPAPAPAPVHAPAPMHWPNEYVPSLPHAPMPQQLMHAAPVSVAAPQAPIPAIRASSGESSSKAKTPENLAIKIQSMGFHHSFPAVRKCTSRTLSLHMPLALLDSHRKAHIMHKAAEKGLNQDVVATHLEMFPDNDWSSDVPRELRVLPVIPVDVGGTSVDAKSKHVKRPLNSFMIYRKAQTQRARANAANQRQKINHQVISSIVGLLWQTEGSQVHDQFSDAAAVEKFLHSEQHPDYKFKPRKKAKAPSPSSLLKQEDSSEESA